MDHERVDLTKVEPIIEDVVQAPIFKKDQWDLDKK